MQITDFERSRSIQDVAITLTREEAEDLAHYLSHLLKHPTAERVYLSEVSGVRLEKDLTIQIVD